MDLEIKGRTALITGGSKGIGLACARRFAMEGCNVHIAARSAEALAAAKASLDPLGVKVVTHAVDLRDGAAVKKLAADCAASTSWSTTPATFPAGRCSTSTRRSGATPGNSRCSATSTSPARSSRR